MTKKTKIFIACLFLGLIIAAVGYIWHQGVAVLDPAGPVGSQERRLMIIAAALGLVVVIPVYIITVFISLKYRESNTRARKYNPTWDHSRRLELTWWAIPSVIILILGTLAWTSSHSLDPYRPLASDQKPLTIQVIALNWKWLFIYPKQNIASLNYLQIPVGTPVDFNITSDAPMNSFWIPSLGGQIYAMPGMSTQLHLMASRVGTYQGVSANISGNGFAGMSFKTVATSSPRFQQWVAQVKQAKDNLSFSRYDELAKPSKNQPVSYFSTADPNIYDHTVLKYMVPASQLPPTAGAPIGDYNQEHHH